MDGVLPMEIGGVALQEADMAPMTILMPYASKAGALSDALEVAHGLSWPEVGRLTGAADRGLLWFGRAQGLLIGVAPNEDLAKHAAVVDQSDAWTVVDMQGALAVEALARLTPADLRPGTFGQGHTVRTELGHMAASVTRIGADCFRIMVFRAFARTLVHELTTVLEGVAARAGR
jgi:sarcosine oxidase subunit gamma